MDMASSEATHCYIGKVPGCGCIEAAYVDDAANAKAIGKEVAQWIRDGYEVTRVAFADGEIKMRRCTHRDAREAEARAALPGLF
jgi:hypothetical protein